MSVKIVSLIFTFYFIINCSSQEQLKIGFLDSKGETISNVFGTVFLNEFGVVLEKSDFAIFDSDTFSNSDSVKIVVRIIGYEEVSLLLINTKFNDSSEFYITLKNETIN